MAIQVITNLNPNIKPNIIKFRDFGFLTDGDNVPRYFDKNGGYDWMHLDPTTAITTVETAAGSMNGVVKYFYTEYNINVGDGDFFSGHETNPSPIKTTGTLVNKKVTLTLPTTATNAGFTHKKIYATEQDGDIFYYIGNVTIATATFEDNLLARDSNAPFGNLETSSASVISQEYLNYPISNYRFSIASKSRIFTFGILEKTDGTVSVDNGATAVTGVSTLWTRAYKNNIIYFNGESRGYNISAVVSATSITLETAYAGGTNLSEVTYVIKNDSSMFKWSATHPTTAKPMPWSFPINNYRRIRREDDSQITGGGIIGDQPILFKKISHYLISESGDDFIENESSTKVGTGSHWSIAAVPETGALIFLSYEGRLYQTNGLVAQDLNVDLKETVDGINMGEADTFEGIWFDSKKWYLLSYASEGSTTNDKMLLYDWSLKEWTILDIPSTALALLEFNESGVTTWSPCIGTNGGFVYRLFQGYNLGASTTEGTLKGTITSVTDDTITDSAATFYTTDDGLMDVNVSLFDADGVFQETKRIASNGTNTLTVESDFTSSPQIGWYYEIGSIIWYWKSKIFNFETETSNIIRDVIISFTKVASERNVYIKFYISEDAELPAEADQTITFDLSQDYFDVESLYDNRAKFFQFDIYAHGVNDPVVINNIALTIMENYR